MYKKLRDLAALWVFITACGVAMWVLIFYGMPWPPEHGLVQSWRWVISFGAGTVSIFVAWMGTANIYNHIMEREDY